MASSLSERWANHGWSGKRPDGLPEDGQVWGTRLPNGKPAAAYCDRWSEDQRLDWVAAQREEIALEIAARSQAPCPDHPGYWFDKSTRGCSCGAAHH